MDDVPATTDMNFRNGAVAFAYVATLLLIFVDEGIVTLDDTIERWMPTLPEADTGHAADADQPDHGLSRLRDRPRLERRPSTPTRSTCSRSRSGSSTPSRRPQQFAPGANWSYAHTNFMILGEILAMIGGKPLDELLQERVLDPMGLHHTVETTTSEIPEPGPAHVQLRTAGRLGIPPGGAVLRGVDVLEPAVGHADGRQPDDDDRRHDHDRRAGRHRRAALGGEL